tara:strand:- start:100 stop:852 length:753 start_codon:yes stop_codon:yes gene_type:complete
MKKKIYYLAGLPRAGNTLLGSILNQNPKVKVSPNSMLVEIAATIFLMKERTMFKNFPDHKTIDNLVKKTFEHYYDNCDAEYIFERSCWGTEFNLKLLKTYFDKEPKFLILDRPIVEIVASFVKAKKEGDMYKISHNLFNPKNGKLVQDIRSSRNIVKTKQPHLKITYNDLVKDTEKQIENIYTFFEIPKFKHNYSDLKQFRFNGLKYYDEHLEFNLHAIRTDKIEKEEYPVSDFLNEELITKLKGYNIYE